MLSGPSAEVQVTLKDARPYTSWNVEEQAGCSGFNLSRRDDFEPADYPGYRHVTTEAGGASYSQLAVPPIAVVLHFPPTCGANGEGERVHSKMEVIQLYTLS